MGAVQGHALSILAVSWVLTLHQIETMLFRNTLSLTRVLLFLVISAFAVSTCAQTTGRITGIVKDASGGVIARAEVQAVNEATGEKWKAVTDEAGNYSFLLLPPALYQIEVAAGGFKTAVSKDVPVRITETTAISVSLAVGSRLTIHRLSYKQMGHSLDARWALGPLRSCPWLPAISPRF